MRKIRRMVSVVMISCMMAGCLAGCGSWKETGGTHGERQGTESRSGTERESIAERYRQEAVKEEFEEKYSGIRTVTAKYGCAGMHRRRGL